MGPERRQPAQPPSDLEKRLQENTSLISESERLLAEFDDLLRSARRLLDEQRTIVQKLGEEKEKT